MPTNNRGFDAEKFKVFVRYMIQVAKDKRCVTYGELENVFGLSHGGCGWYAGVLGEYCRARRYPPLNGLIINASDCVPSGGFTGYQTEYGKSWGEIVSDCWRAFHLTSPRERQVKDFSGRDADVSTFLADWKVPAS